MPQGDRFTVSLDTELLAAFDAHLATRGYENRSEAIRDLIRDLLLEPRLADARGTSCGVLAAVCDHQVRHAHDRLRKLLLEFADVVLGSMSRPIDEQCDMIAITLRGTPTRVQEFVDRVQAVRGLLHARISLIPAASEPSATPVSAN